MIHGIGSDESALDDQEGLSAAAASGAASSSAEWPPAWLRPVPTDSALETLCALAREDPDGELMRSLDTSETFTHSAFLGSVQSWAAALARLGVKPEMAVAVMVDLSPAAYFSWLGIAWLRGVEVPLNPELRGQILAHILTSSHAEVAICNSHYLDRLPDVAERVPALQLVVVPDEGEVPTDLPWRVVRPAELWSGSAAEVETEPPAAGEIAAVVYTAGTTGPSKGVIVPWRELSAYSRCYPPEASGRAFRLYSPWPAFHVNGKFAFVETVNRHGTLVIRRRWSTNQFWSDVREHDIRVAVVLGGVSYFLWSQERRPDDVDNPLEHILMAPVLPEFREFEKRFAVKIHTGFASSEAGQPTAAFHPLPNHRTCGRLMPEYELRLVDPEGNDVELDTLGEAVVRAREPHLMAHGYWQMPEATANAWRDGWFHSGDGLRRDAEGYYYYVDRVKDCLRRRGENISSWELESLVNEHPSVAESAAISVPGDPRDPDDEVMVVAVLHEGANLAGDELIAYLQPRTPRFMIPRYVRFTEALPRTHTGRLRKVELRADGLTADTWDRVAAGVVIPR